MYCVPILAHEWSRVDPVDINFVPYLTCKVRLLTEPFLLELFARRKIADDHRTNQVSCFIQNASSIKPPAGFVHLFTQLQVNLAERFSPV